MPDFETAGLDARMQHLEYSRKRDIATMKQMWQTKTRAYGAKLNVKVQRNQMSANEAQMEARAYGDSLRLQINEKLAGYDKERNRLQTFYQPAEQQETDPVKLYGGLITEKNKYESELSEFVQAGAGKVKAPYGPFKRGSAPFVAGALKVKEHFYTPDKSGNLRERMKLRDATREEMQRWASAQAGLEDVNRRLSGVRRNRHVAARTNRTAFDPTGGGTFGQKVNDTKPTQTQVQPNDIDYTQMSDEELQKIIAGG
jgi:hypothetical protein